jgi:hypothetical protein
MHLVIRADDGTGIYDYFINPSVFAEVMLTRDQRHYRGNHMTQWSRSFRMNQYA